jgi:hypothetical protein
MHQSRDDTVRSGDAERVESARQSPQIDRKRTPSGSGLELGQQLHRASHHNMGHHREPAGRYPVDMECSDPARPAGVVVALAAFALPSKEWRRRESHSGSRGSLSPWRPSLFRRRYDSGCTRIVACSFEADEYRRVPDAYLPFVRYPGRLHTNHVVDHTIAGYPEIEHRGPKQELRLALPLSIVPDECRLPVKRQGSTSDDRMKRMPERLYVPFWPEFCATHLCNAHVYAVDLVKTALHFVSELLTVG